MKFTRHGFRELLVGTLVLVLMAAALGYFVIWWTALVMFPVLIWLWAFFRDPPRHAPPHAAHPTRYTMVAPADGRVSDVAELEADPALPEPCVRVGIFLSIFNVHINRSPCDGVVTGLTYRRGRFINAMDHTRASEENESNTIVIGPPADPDKPVAVVRQIVGLIARRIVCSKQVGDSLGRGERVGMIKFGSRTELAVPARLNPRVLVQPGQKVLAGATPIVEVDAMDTAVAMNDAEIHDSEMEPFAQPTPS
jgi:phosphatidylserine decarboxylase